MGVSIYYTARREHRLTDAEQTQVGRVVAEENAALFTALQERLPAWNAEGSVPSDLTTAEEICEGITLYALDGTEPGVVLEGSSKISHSACDEAPMFAQLEHYMRSSLGRLRQAVPGAEWDVHVDDAPLEWQEDSGEYVFGA
jgi:hypothetical protein